MEAKLIEIPGRIQLKTIDQGAPLNFYRQHVKAVCPICKERIQEQAVMSVDSIEIVWNSCGCVYRRELTPEKQEINILWKEK